MQTVSDLFKSKIKEASREFECKITIGDNIYTNEDLVDMKISNGIPGDGFMIGATPSATLDLILLNRGDTIYSTNQINIEIGLNIGSKFEYLLMGKFNIDEVEKTEHTVKFTAYDNMIKFETAYFSSLGESTTLQQVVNELASKTGVQFTGTLPAYNVKKLEGFTCREVLGYVASLCGGNALITRDGKFTIVTPKDVGYAIAPDNYIPPFNLEEVKYKVGKLSCQVGEEVLSKGSLGTDSMELQFENPWITSTILTDIYNKLNGFNYLGYSLKWQGDISLDIGDIVSVTDIRGVVRKLPILNQELNYIGGLTSTISAKGETKNKNSFNSSGSMSNKLNRVVTEVAIVNKAFIDYANINDANIKNLQVETAKIHNLEVETANINNILAGNIGSGSIQTIHLTGKNVVIDNAVIKSAMIDSLDLSKLNAGAISTNKFRITSDNGGIEIVGATQQFKDKNNKVRIQMGQDTQGNFNFILRGADGTTTLIDHTGIKEKAIADDLIKSNMVAADAIGEKQINYSSLITGLNKDDNTSLIKASKVAIDLTGQSLEVAFSSLKSNIDNMEIGGVNLFVKKTATKNKYLNNSGVEVDEPNWFYTDYINVEGMKNIIASGYVNLGSAPSTCYYDSNKRFVKGINNKGQSLSKLITIDSGISYIRFSCDIRGFETLKLEQGTKSTVYSHSPEDIDQVTQSLQTQINANIKGIETLVKDTTIKQGDSTVKLQDFYSSFIQTKGEISQKVTQAEIDSSINKIKIGSTNLLRNTGIEKDTSYFSLANGVTRDTSVKCLGTNTFKYDISGSTADVWRSANPTPVDVVEGEQYSASGYINIASAAINNTATFQLEIQWYDASGKRILTNGTAVDRSIRNKWQLIKCEGKVAPVGAVKANCRIWVQRNGMCWVGRLQLEKGTKCSDWSSSPRDTEQRVNSVEQKITATEITTTITEAINAGTNSFTTMQFVLDKNGATIKNGALRILNNAGTEVLKGDVAGNLIINGLFKQYTSSGIPSIAIQNNMIEIYDWDPPSHKPENKIGGICSVNGTYGSYGRRASVAVYGDINHALILGWDSLNDGIHPVLTIDKPEVVSKLQPVTLWENMSIVDTAKFDFLGKDNNGGTTRQGQIWISSSQDFIITSNFLNRSGTVKLASYKDGSSSAYTNLSANPTGVRIHGALTIDGGKARAVKTTYGTTTLNAVESADALFEDIGEGVVGEDGVCYIYIDPILLDTIDTKCNYQVFVQAYGEGNVYPVERTETYFIVNGTPGLKFGWRLTAKQRGYENYRLEMIDYENPEQDYLDSLREEEIFKEDINYEELGYAYLENYEKELLANG